MKHEATKLRASRPRRLQASLVSAVFRRRRQLRPGNTAAAGTYLCLWQMRVPLCLVVVVVVVVVVVLLLHAYFLHRSASCTLMRAYHCVVSDKGNKENELPTVRGQLISLCSSQELYIGVRKAVPFLVQEVVTVLS